VTRARGLALVRSPHRPGPGPMPDALLRALDIQVRRRIDGLLQGDFSATSLGPGVELAQVRRYEPGDDVRQIEWNVTARTGEPHVRVHVAEKNLTSCVLVDASASMSFGTADRRKADVAEGVVLAIGHFSTTRGNQMRALAFGRSLESPRSLRVGRKGMLGLLASLHADAIGGSAIHLDGALHVASNGLRGRSAVFVVSDFRDEPVWKRALAELAGRHDTIAVEIGDPREGELTDVGDAWLVDPESGRELHVDTSNARLRRRFAEAAAGERAETRKLIRSTGADHVVLSTRGDWLRALTTFLANRKRRR
jgi:uncharacterized protein (DUF58 family)